MKIRMMKKISWVGVLLFPMFLIAQDAGRGINFESNLLWDQIKDKAKRENKFIFVDAYTTWCGPCKLMDQKVYTNDTVGRSINEKFISVKVQMDETKADNEFTRSWYADANRIKEQYKPEGYPCFLFFTPDGELAHRGIGYKRIDEFVRLINTALTNPIGRLESQIRQFKEGKLGYSEMPALAKLLRDNNKEEALIISVAKAYKEKYLDKLPDEEALTNENLIFLAQFPYQLNTRERYFRFFFEHGDRSDQIMGMNISKKIVLGLIKKDEITDRLYKDGIPIPNKKPGWNAIKSTIKGKYGDKYNRQIFPDAQIEYYSEARDWRNYIKYVEEKISVLSAETEGQKLGGPFGDGWVLNHYAWDLFQYCGDKKYLKKGLQWIELGIKLSLKEKSDSSSVVQLLDTKANLLYRIGKVNEAIELESKAIALLPSDHVFAKKFKIKIEKMEANIPTWPIEP